ncbi:MAG: hypothetical protein ABFS24_08795 [Pseudomonadota bacterium]
MPLNEADTCRVYVTPGLREVGWETSPRSITEQYTFTDGRVEFTGTYGYQEVYAEDDSCNKSLQHSLNEFLLMWLNNLHEQGHKIE